MRRGMNKAGALALSAVLLTGIAACGDDDDSDATEDTTPTADEVAGDPAAYCDALIEFNAMVFDVELEEDASEEEIIEVGEQLTTASGPMVDNAPPEVAEAAASLDESALQPLLEGNAEAFNSDETFGAYTALVEASGPVCDFQEVGVTGVDYGFGNVPATLAAGQYSMSLTNEGTEDHEMVIFRTDDAEVTAETIKALSDEDFETTMQFAGAAFAPPGESGSTLTELEAGNYVMICFLPVGGEDAAGEGGAEPTPHFEEGMLARFTVE